MIEAPKVKTVVMGPIASQVYATSWRSKNNDPDGMQKACDDFIKTAELLRAELGITDALQAKVARLEVALETVNTWAHEDLRYGVRQLEMAHNAIINVVGIPKFNQWYDEAGREFGREYLMKLHILREEARKHWREPDDL